MSNPYRGKPAQCFWRSEVAGVPPFAIDPVTTALFQIGPQDRVATAGSCFAQHISRNLARHGFNYFVPETAPPGMPAGEASARNYGVFSARYGNVYTSRQLVQLFQRALGLFQPKETHWQRADGRFVDPFRPQIEPDGFASPDAVALDRAEHLKAVERMMRELDVFVFTLGLTETWLCRSDGAALPVAPGVSGGQWDSERYAFHNLSAREAADDTIAAIDVLRSVNPKARVLLTVSPVPLIATYRDQSVLMANTYSKAALRVAAEEIAGARPDVMYFPSYEIITSLAVGNAYYLEDLRSVSETGVAHVMRVFFEHLVKGGKKSVKAAAVDVRGEIQKAQKVVCDEEAIQAAQSEEHTR